MPFHNILPLHRKDTLHTSESNGHANSKPLSNSSLSSKWREELVATVAEFTGTCMFLFFAFGGTQIANSAVEFSDSLTTAQDKSEAIQAPNTSALLYSSLCFGFSLMINVWVFFRVSGGLFNPAVTLGLYLIGALTPNRAILYFIAQMLAGICAAGIVEAILPGPLNVSTNLHTGVSPARGVFLEMFLTSLLVFTVFMLAAEKHKATYLAPIGIGLALFVAELVGIFFTGGSLNPTRSFGPCVVTHNFPGYHYVYWAGPLMGTLLAFVMYKIVKSVEYKSVNPGQDFDDHEAVLFKSRSDSTRSGEVKHQKSAAVTTQRATREASSSSDGQ